MKRMGVACTPANILITCGSQQALNAYEPYYGRIDPRANTKIPAPGDGKPAQFAYVVTDFANPTKEMLTLAERKRVLAAAAAVNAVVIEDGAYSAFRYDGEE